MVVAIGLFECPLLRAVWIIVTNAGVQNVILIFIHFVDDVNVVQRLVGQVRDWIFVVGYPLC